MTKRVDPCRYCGILMTGKRASHYRSPTREHVVPRSRGGGAGRVILVCLACNQDKAHLTIHEWLRYLREVGDPRAERVAEVIVDFELEGDRLRALAQEYRGRPMPEAIIAAAQTANGGYDRGVLESWGVPWPPPRKWKRQLAKHGIPFVPAEEAEALKERLAAMQAEVNGEAAE